MKVQPSPLVLCNGITHSALVVSMFSACFILEGYGQSGPYYQRGGYDTIAAGLGGLMHITGPNVCTSVVEMGW